MSRIKSEVEETRAGIDKVKLQYQLEQDIMNCWCITDILDRLGDTCEDKETAKVLKALKIVYDYNFEALFSTYTEVTYGEHRYEAHD